MNNNMYAINKVIINAIVFNLNNHADALICVNQE